MNLKQRIKFDFNKSASHYDIYAALQRQVAEKLFYLSKHNYNDEQFVLDLGCGTGYFHEILRKNKIYCQIYQLDLAINMCQIAHSYKSEKCHTICGDMEQLPFIDGWFDVIFASLSVQWAINSAATLKNIFDNLKPGGCAFISTLGPDSLKELSYCFASLDQQEHVNQFYDYQYLLEAAKLAGFNKIEIVIDHLTLYHNKFINVLHSLTKLGAAYKDYEGHNYFGKSKFLQLSKIYTEKFYQQEGYPVTWQIYYLLLVK